MTVMTQHYLASNNAPITVGLVLPEVQLCYQ